MMEYYRALKRREIPTPATMWMRLEDIRQSEGSQKQKEKYRLSLHMREPQNCETHGDRKQKGGCQGEDDGESVCHGDRVLVRGR